jgi:hypothetical protein
MGPGLSVDMKIPATSCGREGAALLAP